MRAGAPTSSPPEEARIAGRKGGESSHGGRNRAKANATPSSNEGER
jgi:general stress protein YciG